MAIFLKRDWTEKHVCHFCILKKKTHVKIGRVWVWEGLGKRKQLDKLNIYWRRWHVVPLALVKPNYGEQKKIYKLFHSCFGIMCWWQATHTTAEHHHSLSTRQTGPTISLSARNPFVPYWSLKTFVLEPEINQWQTNDYNVWWLE